MDTFIRALAKAELHVHLEGSMEPATLCEIDPGLTREEAEARYHYRGFQDFIEAFKWALGFLRGPDEYALATRRLLEKLERQNVRYAEITLSAGSVLWQGMDFGPIYDAVRREADRFSLEVWWILDAIRHFGPEEAMRAAALAAERAGDRVAAFGLGGDERRGPAGRFAEVLQFVREHGLHIALHAGETAGPESVREALEVGAERIGHGVAAAENPDLLALLCERSIPVEVCLSSNVATGVIPSMEAHPLPVFLRAGVPVVLNTDDPAMFHTSLENEYELAARVFDLSPGAVEELARNGFRYGFRAR